MPSKSRRSRGKYSSQRKKRKGRRPPITTTTEPQAVAQAYKPDALPRETAPSTSVSTSMPIPAAKHPYVASEVRRIGILAGIMVAVLIVLSFVLP